MQQSVLCLLALIVCAHAIPLGEELKVRENLGPLVGSIEREDQLLNKMRESADELKIRDDELLIKDTKRQEELSKNVEREVGKNVERESGDELKLKREEELIKEERELTKDIKREDLLKTRLALLEETTTLLPTTTLELISKPVEEIKEHEIDAKPIAVRLIELNVDNEPSEKREEELVVSDKKEAEITKKEVAVEELKAEQIATKDATEINKKKDTIAAEEEEIKDKRFVVVRPVVVRPIGRDVSEVEEKKDTEIVKPIVEREEEIIKKDTTIDAEINKKEAEHHINDESKRFVVVRPVVRPVVVRPVVVRPIGRDVSEVEEEKEKKETVVDKKNVEQVKEDIVESTTLLPVATTTDEIIKPALIESLDTIVADKKPVLEHEHELIKKEIIKRGALDNGHVF